MPRVALIAALFAVSFLAVAHADEFDSAGVKIHYRVSGAGEPVVLVHGLYSNARLNWDLPGVSSLLAKNYRVIAMDCRGHGESDKPSGADAYGEQMAEDVLRLLDHLKIDKAHVVGYSMGGMIALKFVTRHPERVRSAVLGGMGMLRAGGVLERVWEFMPGKEEGLVPKECVRGLARLAVTEAEVKAIEVPVTVVVGDRDPCRRLYVEPLRRVRPDFPVREIAGAGHLTCIAKAEFKREVKKALDGASEKGEKGR